MRLRVLIWSWIAVLSTLAAGPARAATISFADLTLDTVLASDRLEFSGFELPGGSFGFAADDWQLVLVEDEDTLRIEHVGGPLNVPIGLVLFDLHYQVGALGSGAPISGVDLLLPEAGTSTSALGAIRIRKELLPLGEVLEVLDRACGPFGCSGRDLADAITFSPRELLQVRESFVIFGLGGGAEFTYADNVFLAPEPGTAWLLLGGLAGLAGARQPRRRSSSSK